MPDNRIIAAFVFFILLAGGAAAEPCVVELMDDAKKTHVSVESCRDIGTFSLGGYYEGKWEKLTYAYPKPWKGTYISVRAGDLVYSNSAEPKGTVFMDQYLVRGPEVDDGSILITWRLPQDIIVEERFELVEEGVLLSVTLTNDGSGRVNAGVRLHMDTMLGQNDGAPIYIPGDGLKSTEAEYSGSRLDFRYWKAYDSIDSPSLIATGVLNDRSYPSKLAIANWKKSIYSTWDYKTDPQTSILGDSALILYYELGNMDFGQTKTIVTRYINGESILPPSKGYFGIAEIVSDHVDAIYCPGSAAAIKVDVVSRIEGRRGYLTLEVRDQAGGLVYEDRKDTGAMAADSVVDIPFTWQTPPSAGSENFNVVAVLSDENNNEVDRKKVNILLDGTACSPVPALDLGLLLMLLAAVFFIGAVATAALAATKVKGRGSVTITKEADVGTVKVIVRNNTPKEIRECVIVDRVADGAEVDSITSGVRRKDTELVLYVGDLPSGGSAILEYRIKGAGSTPPAVVKWDRGENISRNLG